MARVALPAERRGHPQRASAVTSNRPRSFWAGTACSTKSRRGTTTPTSFSALEEIRTPNLLIRSSSSAYYDVIALFTMGAR
jgi:hypothetical protein